MRKLAIALLALSLSACHWPYRFSGGGLPPDVRTVAVVPLDNETTSPELPRELAEALSEGLEKRLGLRSATEQKANAIVRGKIVRYELDVPIAISADRQQTTTARRRLTIALDIELVRQSDGKVLWQKTNLTGDGEYAERGEATGRKQAIERIVSQVIEGAQSQW